MSQGKKGKALHWYDVFSHPVDYFRMLVDKYGHASQEKLETKTGYFKVQISAGSPHNDYVKDLANSFSEWITIKPARYSEKTFIPMIYQTEMTLGFPEGHFIDVLHGSNAAFIPKENHIIRSIKTEYLDSCYCATLTMGKDPQASITFSFENPRLHDKLSSLDTLLQSNP